MGHLLPVTFAKSTADALYTALQAIIPDDFATLADWNAEIPLAELHAAIEAAKRFETVFAAELQGANTYFVEQCGIYDMSHLISRAELALGENVSELGENLLHAPSLE
jgi:hypothetical protein